MRSHSLTTGFGVAAAIAAASVAIIVPNGTIHAYNAGVKFLDVEAGDDLCVPDPPLPCTPGAGVGVPNVMTVHQNKVGGEYQYNEIGGTSLLDDHLWLSVDYDAGCRTAHHLVIGWIAGDIHEPLQDGLTDPVEYDGPSWGTDVDVGSSKNMHRTKVSLNVPIDLMFEQGLFDWGVDADWFFDLAEDEISTMVWNGMSEADARATAFEMQRDLTVQAGVRCQWNGQGSGRGYTKTTNVDIPVTIKFLPVETSRSSRPNDRPGSVQSAPAITGLALSVLDDPDDPCTLHLSGTIQTDRPMTVQYRFIDPRGHVSGTHSVDVDLTQTAFVLQSVRIPMAPEAEPVDDIILPGHGPGQNYSSAVDTDVYSGGFTIQTVTPYQRSAADGFEVPYCDTPLRTPPAVDVGSDDITAGANPTHAPSPPPRATSSDTTPRRAVGTSAGRP